MRSVFTIVLTVLAITFVATSAQAVSVGVFDLPAWTVTQTTPGVKGFTNPGSNTGDPEVRINGALVPFFAGITLADNANIGTSSDNIVTPYGDPSPTFTETWISVVDNDTAANPATTEQNSAISVGFFPFAEGWQGAIVNGNGTIAAANLATGGVSRTSAGLYSLSGLPSAANGIVFAVPNGNGADNTVTVTFDGGTGNWIVESLDNDGNSRQDHPFSFIAFTRKDVGVFYGEVDADGTQAVTNVSDALAALGSVVVNDAPGRWLLTIGDGTVINPATATLFLESGNGVFGAPSDNLYSWEPAGNSFRIRSLDLPGQTDQNVEFRFLAIPLNTTNLSPSVPEPGSLTLLAMGALGIARRRRAQA